jgi:hypothetical protein
MTPRAARRSALVIGLICVGAALGSLALLVAGAGESTPGDSVGVGGWGGFGFVLSALAFGSVGAILVARMPENRVGWLLALSGGAFGVGDLTYQYADQVLFGQLGQLPGGTVAALLQNLTLSPALGPVGLALLLFPDGRVPSRRWRLAVLPAIAGSALIAIGYALRPGPIDKPFEHVANPLGITGTWELMDTTLAVGFMLNALGLVLAGVAMVSRLRRATGLERQQVKWVAFSAVVTGLFIVPYNASYFLGIDGINQVRDVALGAALCAFPIAAGIAITRHRLYDIDLVINRALVYAALTALLAGTYLGSVLLLGVALEPVTGGSGLAIAASTLAVAGLFRPARARIQDLVDRRFFRSKYDAQQTLERFSTRMRDQVDLDGIGDDLIAVVAGTVQPRSVSLWLRASDDAR